MFECVRLLCSATSSYDFHPCKKQLSAHIYCSVLSIRSGCLTVKCASMCLTESFQYCQEFCRSTLQIIKETFSRCSGPCMLEIKLKINLAVTQYSGGGGGRGLVQTTHILYLAFPVPSPLSSTPQYSVTTQS